MAQSVQHVQHVVFDQEDCDRSEQYEKGWREFKAKNDLSVGNDVTWDRQIQYSFYKGHGFGGSFEDFIKGLREYGRYKRSRERWAAQQHGCMNGLQLAFP